MQTDRHRKISHLSRRKSQSENFSEAMNAAALKEG
jgi:hypothetical protein